MAPSASEHRVLWLSHSPRYGYSKHHRIVCRVHSIRQKREVLVFLVDGVDTGPQEPLDERGYRFLPQDPALFSRYELSCDESDQETSGWDDIYFPECIEAYQPHQEEALRSLQQFATRPIPHIQFRLVLSRATQASVDSTSRLTARLGHPVQVIVQQPPRVTTLFSPLTALAISPMATLHTVTIGLPSTAKHKAYALLHVLILDNRSRVASLGLNCKPSSTIKDLATVCSALPNAHTLHSVKFEKVTNIERDRRCNVLPWIHYAWTHPRVVNQIGSLRRCFVQGSLQSFESTRLDPLAWNSLGQEPKTVWEDENVLPINRNMRIDPHRIDILDRVFNAETERSGWVRSFWYSTGTTATTTKPTTCFETPPTGSKVRRRTIPAQFQVDVVMKRYDWYAVVVPCRGLWWIPCDNLTLNHPPKRARVVKRRRRTIPEISPDDFALSVVYNSSIRMASLVRLMSGAQLTSLCLAGNLKYEELTDVHQSCPRLRALGLRGTLISSQAIVHGYRDGFCRLEALSVFPGWPFYPRELLEPLVNMLCDSKHPGTNCLRTFNFASDDPALIDRLMTANTWLENVHVVWLTPTASPYISQRLMKWHGRQLSRPRPTWLPFLSVASRHLGLSPRLLGANSHSARSRLDEPLLRTILAFASDHRHMMWTRAEFVAQEGWPRLWL